MDFIKKYKKYIKPAVIIIAIIIIYKLIVKNSEPFGTNKIFDAGKNKNGAFEMVKALERYMPGRDYGEKHAASKQQQKDFVRVIKQIFEKGYTQSFVDKEWKTWAPSLKNVYKMKIYEAAKKNETLPSTGKSRSYCIFYPIALDENNKLKNDMGMLCYANKADSELVVSCAHSKFDGRIGRQAAQVFAITGARAAYFSTHHRYQGLDPSCQTAYHYDSTDPAHNKGVYYRVHKMIADLFGKDKYKGLEFHGMGASSCNTCDVYITNGSKEKLVGDAIKLVTEMKKNTDLVICEPQTGPRCALEGGSNIFGRYLNGVPDSDLCKGRPDGKAKKENIMGNFIHIEQKATSWSKPEQWKDAIINTFNTNPNETRKRPIINPIIARQMKCKKKCKKIKNKNKRKKCINTCNRNKSF